MAKPLTSWLVPSFSQHNLRLVVLGCCLHVSVTKFQDKFASLRQVNSPYSWNKFQICCTDMYFIRYLPNFGVFFVFLWISRHFADLRFRDDARYQKPCLGVWTGIHYIHYITANILWRHHWFPLNMTSENRAQKFRTVSTQIWLVLWLVDNLLHPIIRSTAQIWVMLCHQYGIPALVSETFLWGNQCWCHKMFWLA